MADIGEIRAKIILDNTNFSKGISDAKKKAGELGKKAEATAKQIHAIRNASLAVAGGVGLAFGASIKTAADFQSSLSNLQAISSASADDMATLEKRIRDVAKTSIFSASETSDAATELAAAGMNVKQIYEALPAVLTLAATSNMKVSQAAEIATSIMNSMGLKAGDLSHVMDVLAKTANESNAGVQDLGEGFKIVAPLAHTLGMSVEDVASMFGILSNNGIKGSEAATALRGILASLLNPVGQTEQAVKALNLQLRDQSGNLKPMPSLLEEFRKKTDKMTDSQKAQYASMLVGREGVSAFLGLVNAGGDDLTTFTKKLQDSQGAAKKMSDTMQNNLQGQFKQFQSALEELGIEVGEELLPLFTDITKGATEFISVISGGNEVFTSSALKAAGTAAAIALIGTTIAKVSTAMRAFALTPAGMVITALSLIGGAVMGVMSVTKAANDITVEQIETQQKQVRQMDETIATFEDLRSKNQLTNDELLRYMDIQSELQKTTDPTKIKELQKEMDNLQRNSGLSKKELENFLKANKDIIDASPETEQAISEEGNALAKNADAAKEATKAKYDLLAAQTKSKFIDLLNDESDKLKQEKDLISDIKNLESDREGIVESIRRHEQTIADANEVISQHKEDQTEEGMALANQAYLQKRAAEELLKTEKEQLGTLQNKIAGKQKELDTTRKDLSELDKTKATYEQLILSSVGLTSERGKGLDVLTTQLKKLEDQKAELGLLHSQGKLTTDEYNKQVNKIDTQISRIQSAQGELREMNDIAGQTVYKEVKIKTDPSVVKIDDDLKKTVFKTVQLSIQQQRYLVGNTRAHGAMTRHQGGLVGDKSRPTKFHEGGSPALLQSVAAFPPLFDEADVRLRRNEMVLTEAQQANLFRMFDSANTADTLGGIDDRALALLAEISAGIRNIDRDRPIELSINGQKFASAVESDISRVQGTATRQTKRRRGRL